MAVDFTKVYQDWSDERLFDALENWKDYEIVAVDAMKSVLKERSTEESLIELEDKISALMEKKDEEEKSVYESKVLKTSLSDKEFSKSVKNAEGIYYEKPITSGGVVAYSSIFIVSGITGFIAFGVTMASEFFGSGILAGIFIVSSILIYVGIRIVRKNKFNLKLIERNKIIYLEIKEGNETISYRFPFKYTFFAEENVIRRGLITIRTPDLYFVFEDDTNGQLSINEKLPATKKKPYDWPNMKNSGMEVKAKKRYAIYGTTLIDLEKLKKILDGLSTDIEIK